MTILNFETREGAETHVALRGELDLSGLTFLDSTGLRLIVAADQRAREADRRLVVVKGPVAVHRVFSITKLDERLEMVDEA